MRASPEGEVPLHRALTYPVSDLALHSWDVQWSRGRLIELPDDLLALCRGLVESLPEGMLRRPGGFGPARSAPRGRRRLPSSWPISGAQSTARAKCWLPVARTSAKPETNRNSDRLRVLLLRGAVRDIGWITGNWMGLLSQPAETVTTFGPLSMGTDCALTVAAELERRGDHQNLQGQPGQGDNTHRPGLVPPQPDHVDVRRKDPDEQRGGRQRAESPAASGQEQRSDAYLGDSRSVRVEPWASGQPAGTIVSNGLGAKK